MAKSFFFYDLETSGLNPRTDRIMQFAGVRTDETFQPIGEPYNILVQLNDDTLPSVGALLTTGITPQKTREEGYTEAEFCKIFDEKICTPDTTIVGFNNVRFDDEFIRYLLWRNFYDPYEWAWKDGRSRWDMLDVVRMTRALRPEGIEWPVDNDGRPTNRLELLTKMNGINHENAHDALSDVWALIEVTKIIKQAQPQLFSFLFTLRNKKEIMRIVNLDDKKPFVYTSGRYDAAHEKTTVAFPLTAAPHSNVVVYDLRHDPTPFVSMGETEIAKILFASQEERLAEDFTPLPLKQLQYNRCPAVAPLGVLSQENGWEKIGLSQESIEKHLNILLSHPDFAERVRTVYEQHAPAFEKNTDPEAMLYDGFLSDGDRRHAEAVRSANETTLSDFHPPFADERLAELLLHYKARNFPRSLNQDERAAWGVWRANHIQQALPTALEDLQQRAQQNISESEQFILSEIRLWIESVMSEE